MDKILNEIMEYYLRLTLSFSEDSPLTTIPYSEHSSSSFESKHSSESADPSFDLFVSFVIKYKYHTHIYYDRIIGYNT